MVLPVNIPFCLVRPAFHALDPEQAHTLTIKALKHGLGPYYTPQHEEALTVQLGSLTFSNPVGLAAGFDKNADTVKAIHDIGFGFGEFGTVTPKPQDGNPRPRVFRDVQNEAVINRMGFPNEGVDVFKKNITAYRKNFPAISMPVGINIGMNKDQTDPAKDYCLLVEELHPYADYFTINISSPNTPGLRNLQDRENLLPLLKEVKKTRQKVKADHIPLLVKLAPDLDDKQQKEIAGALVEAGVDGIILTNTTLERPKFLPQNFREEMGGLSGAPLTDRATEIIRNFYKLTGGKITIIGIGGISSGTDAYEKIKAGASLVQLYSSLVFKGPEVVQKINKELLELLQKDGYQNINEAVGTAA